MMANNWQRLTIWANLLNRFDYAEFTAACRAQGIEPQPAMEFAQKAGMVSCGVAAYPELPVSEAYLKFIEDNQVVYSPPPADQQQPQGCSGCGSTVVDQSRGLGDTIAKITHATKLDKLAEIYTMVTGQPCGCASRQEALNKLLPYNIKEEN